LFSFLKVAPTQNKPKIVLPYFIEYSVHASIVCTLILKEFLVHYPVNLKPFSGTFQV